MAQLKCQRCKHSWTYRGKSQYYASCPVCKSSVKVKQSHVGLFDSILGRK